MDNSSPNPPTTIFGNLSLVDHGAQPQHDGPSNPGRSSPCEAIPAPAPPNSRSESSSSPSSVYVFGQQSSRQTPALRVSFDSIPVIMMLDLQSMAPRTSQLQSPFRCVTTTSEQSGRRVSASNTQTHLSQFLSPSSSPLGTRQRLLSFTPVTPPTPSIVQDETPGSDHVPSPTPEPPVPITPYDPRQEPAPIHTLFKSAFQDALKEGPELAKMVVKAIQKLQTKNPKESDSELSKFLDGAKDLQRFQGTDTRTVAVLGASGEGKSSLINSLLHFPGVAETGDLGSACTSVVTEYRQKKADQTEPITINVEYLSMTEIRELIQELLWSYRQLFLPTVESNETSEQEYNRYIRESELAWSALSAAFKHKRQFTPKFAQDTSDGALESITNQLVDWTREIEWPTSGADGFWTSTAQTAEECVQQTKLFMQDKLWQVMAIYENYPTGIVLADLPARVRATQDYLIKCDNILIVAKISRAITDQYLKSSLFYVLSRHVPTEWEQSGAQRLKVAVVCTKSEDINLGTARREFCGPEKAISTDTMARLDTELEVAKTSGDRAKKKAIKKQQELLLVQARNEHVKRNLQSAYSSEMDGRSLDVFCVSNKWYEKYSLKGNTEFARASGIPELRHFCHSLTADAQLSEAKHFLRSRLSALLNTLELWATSLLDKQNAIEKLNASVQMNMKEAIDQLPTLVNTFRQDFSRCFEKQIMSFFGQYNAWCLNNGDHQTLNRGHENWNAKIIWKMRMELESQWDLMEEEVTDVFSALLIVGLANGIQLAVLLPSRSVGPIANSIAAQMGNLEYKLGREENGFLAEVRAIRRYASESNYNSYILKDMIPVYRDAASQKKTGKFGRQISIIQGHIEEGLIFPKLSIAVAESMNNLITLTSTRLGSILSDCFDIIQADLNIMFQSCERSQATQHGLALGQKQRKVSEFDVVYDIGTNTFSNTLICNRCHESFESRDVLFKHQHLEDPYPIKAAELIVGKITLEQAAKLGATTKKKSNMSDEMRWFEFYDIIFLGQDPAQRPLTPYHQPLANPTLNNSSTPASISIPSYRDTFLGPSNQRKKRKLAVPGTGSPVLRLLAFCGSLAGPGQPLGT
ncbi:hypothetical protein FCIRC_1708 [Fusarium circinatum]|uniref:DUF7605 domain-containing protein n=1 Tax=Fusarium circinatum TaxID=48490 RepID=A0A8H5X665_FUSCI|nr:hypothetical protein FCIRC_1708 [Fusarium circinatum]